MINTGQNLMTHYQCDLEQVTLFLCHSIYLALKWDWYQKLNLFYLIKRDNVSKIDFEKYKSVITRMFRKGPGSSSSRLNCAHVIQTVVSRVSFPIYIPASITLLSLLFLSTKYVISVKAIYLI